MKAHEKCDILAHSKFMETHFGPNEPAAFCAEESEPRTLRTAYVRGAIYLLISNLSHTREYYI
jgi:hypothetical protein